MTTIETLSEQYYTELMERAGSVLKLSLSEIKEKYSDYPLCIMEYIREGVSEKSIEIRFDKEEVTLACVFDSEGGCISVFIVPDYEHVVGKITDFLIENYDYSFPKSRFMFGDYFLKVKELEVPQNNLCLVFYQ